MKNKRTQDYGVKILIFATGLFTFFGLTFDHILFHEHLIYAQIPCVSIGKTYKIDIEKNIFTPSKLTTHRCDQVIFTNIDKQALYDVAFGKHPKHIQLPGFTEKVLGYKKTNSIILYNTGTFSFHDHLKDEAEGELIVK